MYSLSDARRLTEARKKAPSSRAARFSAHHRRCCCSLPGGAPVVRQTGPGTRANKKGPGANANVKRVQQLGEQTVASPAYTRWLCYSFPTSSKRCGAWRGLVESDARPSERSERASAKSFVISRTVKLSSGLKNYPPSETKTHSPSRLDREIYAYLGC